jgi:hypothetical protein
VLSQKEPNSTKAESAQGLASRKKDALEDELKEKALSHPLVKAAQTILNGEVKSVTPLKQGGPK